jgi:large subunit ribosomal protein L15
MDLSNLQPRTPRKFGRRVGRGGKRGTYSGKGTKGQKSRAGASVKPGFRGGDNRLWQLFPKQRGASKKPGGSRPHPKHRYFMLRNSKSFILNLDAFDKFKEGDTITPTVLKESGVISFVPKQGIKVLGDGIINKKLKFEGLKFSNTAREKVVKAGGMIK